LKAVLDASTIITLVKRQGDLSIDALEGSITLALAYYEIGNALRTETELTRALTTSEANRLLYIFYRLLTVITIKEPTTADEAIKILDIARETDTSFYDAAYLTQAKVGEIPLATEDKRLGKKVKKNGIRTINADNFSV
jgi:predicted nucleic acid-binding protein